MLRSIEGPTLSELGYPNTHHVLCGYTERAYVGYTHRLILKSEGPTSISATRTLSYALLSLFLRSLLSAAASLLILKNSSINACLLSLRSLRPFLAMAILLRILRSSILVGLTFVARGIQLTHPKPSSYTSGYTRV